MATESRVPPTNVVDVDRTHMEFRMWLMFLTSLAATVTFTAGHAPPGGFWSADDKAKGYVAGTSVMRSKFHCRYLVFYYSNSAAFFLSLAVIVMLAQIKKANDTTIRPIDHVITALVSACIASLAISYIAGSWETPMHGILGMGTMFAVALFFMFMNWIIRANKESSATGTPVNTNSSSEVATTGVLATVKGDPES